MPTDWLILTATLPTSPSGLRVRVWRGLKATGAGALREGVYILPAHAPSAEAFKGFERTIAEAGAEAHLLVVQARDDAQRDAFTALFDRSAQHAELQRQIKEARHAIAATSEASLRKTLRDIEAQSNAVDRIDFFPGRDSRKSADALAALRRQVDLHFSPGEPVATEATIPALDIEAYQGRTWATRRRPWVDRLATAWLVQRFVDRRATFLWLADARHCPATALGFDFDGATFTHVGDKVSFEVVAQSFGLLGDPALGCLARLVHCIDVGGMPVDEAPGIELLVRGLQARHPDDDALLAAALPLFDACLAAFQVTDDH
jgi:hypothetical protein